MSSGIYVPCMHFLDVSVHLAKLFPKKLPLAPLSPERIMQLFLSTPLAICFLCFLNPFVVCEISDYFVLHCHTSLHFNNYWFYIELIWFFTSWADFVCTRTTLCSPFWYQVNKGIITEFYEIFAGNPDYWFHYSIWYPY